MNAVDLNNFRIRSVLEKDWPILYAWFDHEGWGVGNSFVVKFATEMKHCNLMVIVDDNDIPLSYLAYAIFKKYVHIGSYITDPNLKGRGIGFTLWKKVLNDIGADKNYHIKSGGLMTEKYKTKSNFQFTSPIKCNRYVGKMDLKFVENAIKNNPQCAKQFTIGSVLNKTIVHQLIQYDAEVHMENNSNFLAVWLEKSKPTSSDSVPSVFTVFAKNELNQIVGYGSIVRCRSSRKISPLFADNFVVFLNLLQHLIPHYFVDERELSEDVIFNVPSTNSELIKFLVDANFELRVSLDRSFTKEIVEPCFEKLYCFTSHLGVPE